MPNYRIEICYEGEPRRTHETLWNVSEAEAKLRAAIVERDELKGMYFVFLTRIDQEEKTSHVTFGHNKGDQTLRDEKE